MPRPRRTTKTSRKRGLLDVNRAIVKIHVTRPKQQIHSGIATNIFIHRFRPRIFLKIRPRLKLQRIHKNTDCNFPILSGMLPRHAHQFQVPPMQRPHRGNQHRPGGSFTRVRLNFANGFDDFHRRTPYPSSRAKRNLRKQLPARELFQSLSGSRRFAR